MTRSAAVLHQLGMLMHFQALDRGRDATLAADEEALFQQALRLRRAAGDLAGVAESLFGVGLVHQVLRDDSATAIPYFREALPLADEHAGDLTRSEVHRHVGAVDQAKQAGLRPERIAMAEEALRDAETR
jgi:hypothetical protein